LTKNIKKLEKKIPTENLPAIQGAESGEMTGM